MNRVQKVIFQEAPHQTASNYITLVASTQYYNFPAGCEADDIVKVTIETSNGSGEYDPLPYKKYTDDAVLESEETFYSTYNGQIFISPSPSATDAGIKVYIYFNKTSPTDMSASSLSVVPDLMADYQDLLVFGCIIAIAEANQDVDAAMYYRIKYQELKTKLLLEKLAPEPSYPSVKNVMPTHTSRAKKRSDAIWDLIPH